MEFIITPTTLTNKVMCIYKMIFNTGHYYIGGTFNLSNRITKHKRDIDRMTHTKQVNEIAALSASVTFEILQFVNKKEDIKRQEEISLKLNVGLPFCLNFSPLSCSTYTKRRKQKILRFNERGNQNGEYNSITDAAKSLGVSYRSIIDNLLGKTSMTKNNFYFRKINSAGQIVEPKIIKKRKVQTSEVVKYDLNMTEIGRFKSIREASIDIKSHREVVSDSIHGVRKTAVKKLYHYKFADEFLNTITVRKPKKYLYVPKEKKNGRRVWLFDIKGEPIASFKKKTEAAKHLLVDIKELNNGLWNKTPINGSFVKYA